MVLICAAEQKAHLQNLLLEFQDARLQAPDLLGIVVDGVYSLTCRAVWLLRDPYCTCVEFPLRQVAMPWVLTDDTSEWWDGRQLH